MIPSAPRKTTAGLSDGLSYIPGPAILHASSLVCVALPLANIVHCAEIMVQ